MAKIQYRSIRNAFSTGVSHRSQPHFNVPIYLSYRRAFNPTSLFVVLTAIFLSFGFFRSKRELIVVGLSFGILHFLLFKKNKRVAESLRFHRKAPKRGNAGDEITVEISIVNTSPFKAVNLLVYENFHGTTKEYEQFYVSEILPFSTYTLRYKCLLNSGSGVFQFDPLEVQVSDGLGITEFTLTEALRNEIEVFPQVKSLPSIAPKASHNSIHYGLYEVQVPGVSVNFTGVRDYVRGDSLRHISWKRSAKSQKFIVKEFEKSVNIELSIVLEMDQKKHAGSKTNSTWEYVKDLGLSLIAQQLSLGNSVQVISQGLYIPAGRGEAQSNHAILSIGKLKPIVSETPILQSSLPHLTRSSSIFYVSPCFLPSFEEERDSLKRLRSEGYEVYVFLIEPNSIIRGDVHAINRLLLSGNEQALKDKRDETLVQDLCRLGIHTYWVTKDRGLEKSLLHERIEELH